MTPLIPQVVKAAAITVGVGIVLQRFSWREYPALLTWMLWEVAMQVATLGAGSIPQPVLLAQDGICAAVICEVIRSSRLKVQIGTQIRFFVCVLAGAKILASIPDLTPIQATYLFRSYVLWAAFFVLAAITLIRIHHPVRGQTDRLCQIDAERRADRIYRIGATAWVFCMAVGGSFVKGGIGYKFLPYTMHTWHMVYITTHAAIAITVVGMSLAMYLSSPGRKRAAKTPNGLTRTGLIETVKVA